MRRTLDGNVQQRRQSNGQRDVQQQCSNANNRRCVPGVEVVAQPEQRHGVQQVEREGDSSQELHEGCGQSPVDWTAPKRKCQDECRVRERQYYSNAGHQAAGQDE